MKKKIKSKLTKALDYLIDGCWMLLGSVGVYLLIYAGGLESVSGDVGTSLREFLTTVSVFLGGMGIVVIAIGIYKYRKLEK